MSSPIFDPTIPVDNSWIASGELRDQFNSLNDHCSDLDSSLEGRAFKPSGVDPLSSPISNPPTQAQVTEIRDKINELLAALNA
jgi:hypothetical protein